MRCLLEFLFLFEVWKSFWTVIGLGWQKKVWIGKCHCLDMKISHDVFQVILAIMVIRSSWCMEDVANSWSVLMEIFKKLVKIWEAQSIMGDFWSYCYGPATNKWRITRQDKFYWSINWCWSVEELFPILSPFITLNHTSPKIS
jgi:hypothetical protein